MSKWMKTLKSYEDAVKFEYDAFAPENVIQSPSPYANWIFANKSHGLPKGCGLLLFSEPKAGKSLFVMAMIQELHQRDKEAIAIVFNSEMRGAFQSDLFEGIDKDRLVVYDTSRPEEIFDRFADDIWPLVQDGMPLGLVAFDSITMIGGTKADGRSVNDHLVGDRALTLSKGWDRVIPLLKKKKIPYIGVEQMRMNVDTSNPHAPKEKMAANFKTKHVFEYFVSLKRANSKEDKLDIEGNDFSNDEIRDARGNGNVTGHKIYVKMEQSSLGTAGRAAMFTLDYKKGLINKNEEIFLLGYGNGVIKREGNSFYVYKNVKINGKGAFAAKIREDEEFAGQILADVIAKDADPVSEEK